MGINYRSFMGFTTPTVSKTDELLTDIFKNVLHYLDCAPDNYKNFREFVEESKINNPSSLYFWEWMDEKGFNFLESLDKRLPDVEELADFLNYRDVVLQMDYNSGVSEMLLLSITEFLIATNNFITSYFETAATTESVPQYIEFTIPATETHIQQSNWLFVQSLANDGAGLLLYEKIKDVYTWISQKLMRNTFYLRPMCS